MYRTTAHNINGLTCPKSLGNLYAFGNHFDLDLISIYHGETLLFI